MKDDYKFNVKTTRPEETHKRVSDYYKDDQLVRYANSKAIMRIQEKITIRALEILDLPEGKNHLILDLGCGPGFSSVYLREIGYDVISIDIISEFLKFYEIRDLNPLQGDICFLPFQPCTFDAAISISSLQWVLRNIHDHDERVDLSRLAESLYSILKPKSKAVFQFYPKNDLLMKEVGKIFTDYTKFDGNFIIDNPQKPIKRNIFLYLQKEGI